MRTDKMHPLPWKHETDGKKMSVVEDDNGHVVCGSYWFTAPMQRRGKPTLL